MKFKRNAEGLLYHRFTTPKNAAGVTKRIYIQCKAEYNSVSALMQMIRDATQRHMDGRFTTRDTFKSYVDEKFLKEYPAAKNLQPTSRAVQKYLLGKVIDEIGSVPLAEVNAGVAGRMVAALQARGTSDRTRQMCVGVINTVLRWAVRAGDLNARPEIERPRVRNYQKAQPYTREEAQRLLAAAKSDVETALILLMFDAGLRRGEVLGLQWAQVDCQAGKMLIDRQYCRGLMRHTKSGRERWVHMSAPLKAALLKIRAPQMFLFTSEEGGPMSENWMYYLYNQACKRAGLRKTRLHDGRHAYASFRGDEGLNVFALKELLGHSDIRTTQGYVHATPPTRPGSVLDPV